MLISKKAIVLALNNSILYDATNVKVDLADNEMGLYHIIKVLNIAKKLGIEKEFEGHQMMVDRALLKRDRERKEL